MLVLFFKAEQLSLFPTPTYVAGHVRKDGVAVAPHVAMRKRKITGPKVGPAPARVKAPKLDRFIARHGGPDHLRATLMEMSAHQRGKLIDAMSQLDAIHTSDVIKRLGMHEDQADPPTEASEPTKAEERLQRLRERRDPEGRGDPAMDEVDAAGNEPKDGESEEVPLVAAEEPVAGTSAAAESEFEGAEDRQDLAEAMARDPHSEETKELIRGIAAKMTAGSTIRQAA